MKNREYIKKMIYICMSMIKIIVILSGLLIGIGLFARVDKVEEYKNYFAMGSKYQFWATVILCLTIAIIVMAIVDSFEIGFAISNITLSSIVTIWTYIMTGSAQEELEYSYYYFRGMGASYHLLRIFSMVVLVFAILKLIILIYYHTELANPEAHINGAHDINKPRIICDACGKNYESDRASCPYCGSRMVRGYMQVQPTIVQNMVHDSVSDNAQQWFCAYCGTQNKVGKFCVKCGKQKP